MKKKLNQDVHNNFIISDTFDLSFDVNKMSSRMHMKSLMIRLYLFRL